MTAHDRIDAIDRRTLLRAVGAGTTGAAGIGGAGLAGTAGAQSSRPTVDLASPEHPVRHEASGLLYGLSEDGAEPSDTWLEPVDLGLQVGGGARVGSGGWGTAGESGYASRWNSIVQQYERVTSGPHDAEYCIRMSDLWGSDATQADSDPQPGDDGDWSSYYDFLDRIVNDVDAAGMDHDEIQYEIWNEPNIDLFWPRSRSQFHELWERGVARLRDRHPDVRIVGPGHTHFEWGLMSEFLDVTVDTGTVPDVLNWHVLQTNNDAVDTAAQARDLLAQRGLDDVELEINEYVPQDRENAGYTAWDLVRVEKSDVDYAALGNWSYCCSTPAMCATLTQDGSSPTGRWWLYARYGQTGGDVVSTQASGGIDSAANVNAAGTQSRIVLGNDGTSRQVDVAVRNVDRIGGSRVRIKVERLPTDGPLPAPLVDQDYVADVAGSDHTVSLDWSTATDAFVITVTPATPAVPDGTYRVEATHSGQVLGVADGSSGDGATVQQQADEGADHQRWTVEHVGDGVCQIENLASGLVLAVEGGGTDDGTSVQQQSNRDANNQQWRVEETRSGLYRVEAVHSGKVLDVEASSSEVGASVHQWVDRSDDNQRWRFEPVEPTEPCADVAGGSTEVDGQTVCDVTDDGSYRDVTGDGSVGQGDVAAFFTRQHRSAWKRPELFDFSGNDAVTHGDVVDLFDYVAIS